MPWPRRLEPWRMRAARVVIEYHSLCGRVRTVCPSGWVRRSASCVSCSSRPGGTRYLRRCRNVMTQGWSLKWGSSCVYRAREGCQAKCRNEIIKKQTIFIKLSLLFGGQGDSVQSSPLPLYVSVLSLVPFLSASFHAGSRKPFFFSSSLNFPVSPLSAVNHFLRRNRWVGACPKREAGPDPRFRGVDAPRSHGWPRQQGAGE